MTTFEIIALDMCGIILCECLLLIQHLTYNSYNSECLPATFFNETMTFHFPRLFINLRELCRSTWLTSHSLTQPPSSIDPPHPLAETKIITRLRPPPCLIYTTLSFSLFIPSKVSDLLCIRYKYSTSSTWPTMPSPVFSHFSSRLP